MEKRTEGWGEGGKEIGAEAEGRGGMRKGKGRDQREREWEIAGEEWDVGGEESKHISSSLVCFQHPSASLHTYKN